MAEYKKVTNNEFKEIIKSIKVENILRIELRTIGLLDTFGKIIIDIFYKDTTKLNLEIYSPVDTRMITDWLDTNELLDITTLYKF